MILDYHFNKTKRTLSVSYITGSGGKQILDFNVSRFKTFYSTPNGYYACEGSWCDEAYEAYLEEENTTENIVKYASLVKLTNKESIYGQQT